MSTDQDPTNAAETGQAGGNVRLVRRQRIALAIITVCALLAVAGLVGSRFVQSPQEAAASVGPPTPTVLTAPVKMRVLKQTLITRGVVTAARQVTVSASGGPKGRKPVVTAVDVHPGQSVKPGQVLVEISGRPVIALPGTIPNYRDLKPGEHGKDITELQTALATLGDYHGKPSGSFDATTKHAVRKLYHTIGYDPPTTSGSTNGPGSTSKGAANPRQAAQNALTQARDQMAALRRQGAAQVQPAGGGGKSTSSQLVAAKSKLADAQRHLHNVVATTGVMVPASEIVFVPKFPARVTTVSAHLGDKPDGSLLTVSSGALRVEANVRPDQAKLLDKGAPVHITSETLGKTITATLTGLGQPTSQTSASGNGSATAAGGQPTASGGAGGGGGGGAVHVPATITPGSPLSSAWAGHNVRVTFTTARTHDKVLVVPVSAISTSADGTTAVTVYTPGHHQGGKGRRRVRVHTGASADGYVQVEPTQAETLRAGQKVVVGRQ